MKLLEELTQAWGVSGREKNVRAIIKREIKDYVDDYFVDAMGNLIAYKKGTESKNKKKIMYTAHMDEIGFQVTHIEGDGRIKVCSVGWTWTGSIYNDKVIFQNGVVGVWAVTALSRMQSSSIRSCISTSAAPARKKP